MFSIGTVYRAVPDTSSIIDGYVRVVGIDQFQNAYLIRLDKPPFKVPYAIKLEDLELALKEGNISTVNSFDIGLPKSLQKLSDVARKKLELNKQLMEPLILDEELIFHDNKRNQAFIAREKETKKQPCGACRNTIRNLFLRILASGWSELAYAPKYNERGGVGSKQSKKTARRGPKPKNPKNTSKVKLPDVEDDLRKGLELYYFSGQHTFDSSYHLTINRSFVDKAKLEKAKGKTFTIKEVRLPRSQRPTKRQFRYVMQKMEREGYTREKKPRKSRQPEKKKTYSGTARNGLIGPGSRFEIDATKYQVRPVSKYDSSRVLEPPTLYLIIDVWSGAIVGYAFSLESEGWPLTVKALLNCYEDKQKTFDRLNLPFNSSPDWSSHQLSSRLTADRGSMVSDKAGPCIEINGHIEITPAMRGDRKGNIEGAINLLKKGHDYVLPGKYPKNRKRREPDGINTAALTFEALEKIVVETIVFLNSEPVPEKNIPIDMKLDGSVPLTYMGLYEWGLRNRPGQTRTIPPQDVYINLMTKDVASMTEKGISYKGSLFKCEALESHGYCAKAARNGNYKIDIRFYELSSDLVWFFDEVSKVWLPAENQNEEIRRLKEAFFELEIRHQAAEELRDEIKGENVHRRHERSKQTKKEITEAQKKAKVAKAGKTKTEIKKDIGKNNATEKAVQRLTDNHDEVKSYMSAINHEKGKPSVAPKKEHENHDAPETPTGSRPIDRWRKKHGKKN